MEAQACVPERDLPSCPLSIRLFGEFELQRGGAPLPSLRSRTEVWLLALLLLRAGRPAERAWLAGLFWPDSRAAQALNNLRRSLSNLRQVLGDESARLISPTSHTIAFDSAGVSCDVHAFDAAVERDETPSLRRAVTLYRGPLLPDCDLPWMEPERSAREQVYLRTLETLAREEVREGDTTRAVCLLRHALSVDPLREPTHRALLVALASAGDRAGVTLAYRALRLRLHDALQTEPSAETRDLYQRLLVDLRTRPSPSRPVSGVRRGLPIPLTSLIGRADEIRAITGHLSETRLVTLVGTGGIGKTRLALEVASGGDFPDGVYFLALAPLSDPARIAPELIRVVELQEQDDRPALDIVVDFLRDQQALIVLDNCEHLIESCAELAERLLSRCPPLRLLATSREALRIAGERVCRVPALPVPGESESAAAASLLGYPSVRLFAERAAAVADGFALTEKNAPAVATLCRRLDGLPLALELAAARVSVLTADEIVARLEDRFALLTGGSRTAPPRQQTLAAALSWSYDLLSPAEQRLFGRLSVFSGDFDVEAARAVAAPLPDVATHLFGLVEKSLVSTRQAEGQTRYFLLETVREYAGTHLQACGEGREVRERHRTYYHVWAEAVDRELRRSDPARWGALLEAEHMNLRQALLFCQEDPLGGETGLQLITVLAAFWDLRGYLSEGRKLLHAALLHPGAQAPSCTRADALYCGGQLAWGQGDYDGARTLCQEASTIYREQASAPGLIRTLGSFGDLDRDQGDYPSARRWYDEALQLSRQSRDRRGVSSSLLRLAIVTGLQGDRDTARALFEQSLTLAREVGEPYDIALALNGLGNLNRRQGDFATARAQYEESLALRYELGFKPGIAATLMSLGNLAMDEQDPAAARTLFAESFTLHREIGSRSGIACSLESLGRASYAVGDCVTGRSLCAEALTLFREIGDTASVAVTLRGLAHQALDQRDYGAAGPLLAEFLSLAVAREDMTGVTGALEMYIALAAGTGRAERAVRLGVAWIAMTGQNRQLLEETLAAARRSLGDAIFARAESEGAALDWKAAVDYALQG